DGLMDVKTLEQLDADGLKQWRPVMKDTFSLPAAEVALHSRRRLQSGFDNRETPRGGQEEAEPRLSTFEYDGRCPPSGSLPVFRARPIPVSPATTVCCRMLVMAVADRGCFDYVAISGREAEGGGGAPITTSRGGRWPCESWRSARRGRSMGSLTSLRRTAVGRSHRSP